MFGRRLTLIVAGALALLFAGTRAHGQAVIDVPSAVGDGLTTDTAATLWDAIDAAVDGDTIRINVFEVVDTVVIPPNPPMPRINFSEELMSRMFSDLTIKAVIGDGDGNDAAVAITAGNGDGTGTTATVFTILGDGDADLTTLSGLEFYFFSTDNPVDLISASATFEHCKFIACADASIRVDTGTETLPLTLNDCVFDLCSTANAGGPALRIDGTLNGDLRITDTAMTDCAASAGNSIGGAIEILNTADSVTVEFIDSTITGNVALGGAGAMRIEEAGDDFTLRIQGTATGLRPSILSDNTITEGTGGAISIESIGVGGTLEIDAAGGDVTIDDNGPTLSPMGGVDGGGAIYIGDGGTMTLVSLTSSGTGNLSVRNNVSNNGDGGAIRLPDFGDNATITLSNTGTGTMDLSNNSATGGGGFISGGDAGVNLFFDVRGATIDGNTAGGGSGGVLSTGTMDGLTLLLDDSTIQNNSSTGDEFTGGGAFYFGNCEGDLNLDLDPANGPLVLSNNTTTGGQGGAIRAALVTGHVTCDVQSTTQPVTVTNNSASGGDGGAIRIDSCFTLDITLATGAQACTLTDNSSDQAGGFLSIGNAASDASITIDSGGGPPLEIEDNTAGTDGGAVRVGSIVGALTLNVGATSAPNLFNNVATTGDGGCISIGTTGDASLLQFVSGIFTNNNAGNGDGGAVYIASIGTNSTLALGTVNFNVNTAQGNGGAICIDTMGVGAGVIIETVNMTGNVATTGDGGALFIGTVTDTTIDIGDVGLASGSPTFDDNQATGGDGGAIAIGPVIGTADMQIVTGAVETVTFTGNDCGGNGGAVRLLADSGSITLQDLEIDGSGGGDENTASGDGGFLSASALAGGTINVLNCDFTEQEAGVNGGALAFDGISDTAVVNVAGGSVTDCQALAGDGGGIYVGALASFAQVNLDGGLVLDGNTAFNNGGGIALGQLGSDPVITVDGITGINNTATNGSGGGLWISGDGDGGSITLNNSTFTGNATGVRGGGVALGRDGTARHLDLSQITITGLMLDSNVQAGGGDPTEGGGLSLFGTPGTVVMSDCTVTDNVSGSDGGGLWMNIGATTIMTMTDLVVMGNLSDNGSGGGMRLAGGLLVTVKSTLPAPPPLNHPIDDILDVAFSARISGNTAEFDGGGLVWDPQFPFPASPRGTAFIAGLLIDSVQIDGNISATGSGGGLRFDGGPAYVRNCPVTSNTSFLDGGGVQVDSGDVRIQSSRIGGTAARANTAGGDGGGVNVNTLGTGLAVIRGCGICENLANGVPNQVAPPMQPGDASPTPPASVDDGINDYDLDGDSVCLEAELLVITADGLGDAATPALAVQGVAPFARAVIEVEPGTYSGTIDILSKNIIIIGLGIGGDPSQVVLQGNGVDGAVVVVRSRSEVWLECLTITGGIEDVGNGHFGGVFISGSLAFLDIENCDIISNAGGGMVVDGGASASVRDTEIGSADGVDFGNTSTSVGGGVRIVDGDIQLTNTNVRFNDATTDGGGLWINDMQNGTPETASLIGCAVDQNSAGDDGGGFWLGDQASVVHGETTGNPPTVTANDAGNDGGGVHLDETSLFTMTGNSPDDMALVSGNTAVNDGGGIKIGSNCIATLTDVEIGSLGNGNAASHDGGGVHMVASGQLAVNDGSTMIDNAAATGKGGHLMFEGGGGAISFAPPSGFEVTGGAAVDGGSIAFENGSLDLTSITVLASTATNDGGVIWAGDNAPLTLTSVLFDGTIIAGGDGGCVRSGTDSDLTIVNSTLGNGTVTAAGDGGIVKLVGGATVLASIEGTNLVGGTAGGNGGGLQMDEGMLILDTLVIDDCQAVNGGGLWISGQVIASATDCNITNCTAIEGVGGLAALDPGASLTVDTTGAAVFLAGGQATTAAPGGGLGRGGAFHISDGASLELTGTGGTLQLSGSQADGEGGAFAVDLGGTVVATDASILNCQAGLNGGIAYINGTVTLNGVAASNSTAGQDGGMAYVVTEAASIVLGPGTSMASNSAGRDGGHLWFPDLAALAAPPMALDATVTFAAGIAGNDGGAIRFGDNTQWIVSSYDLSGNNATVGDGGSIRVGDASIIQLTSCDLSTNTSGGDGGAVRVGNGSSTITLVDTPLTGSTAGGLGGAVAAGSSATVGLSSTGAQVNATSCTGNGGGIVSVGAASIVSIADHLGTNCQSTAGGGLVNAGDGSLITLTNVSAANTVAAGAGGLVLTGIGSSVTLTDVTATDAQSQATGGGVVFTGDVCTVVLTNVSASGAKATAGVGGVVAMGEDAVLTLDTVTAQNCEASGNGGAIRVLSESMLNFDDCDFSGSTSTLGAGGVLYTEDWDVFPGDANIPFLNTPIDTGSAAGNGGAIRAGNNAWVELINSNASARTSGASGGSIYLAGVGQVDVTGGSLANCQAATDGGGIFVSSTGTVTVTGSSLAGCDALAGAGGAINMTNDSIVTVTNTPVTGCTASTVGGAISMGDNAVLTMDTIVATGCTAGSDGGVVRVEQDGDVIASDCSVGGTSTTGHGGGFSLGTGTVAVMTDNTFTNCSAAADGGGIQHDGDVGATLTISNCDFSGNSAASGGAVNLDPGTTCGVSGGTWTNNSATADGGHIAIARDGLSGDSSIMIIDGGPTFTNGTAGDQGGVLYGSGNGSITITGIVAASMSGSSADSGGALAADQDFLITASQLAISNCTAAGGGGVHVSDTGTITLTAGSIDTCSADNGGGGYVIGTLNMNGTSANGNQAIARDGGQLYFESGSEGDIQACTFNNGSSVQGGGAVLLESTADPSFSTGCTFDGHQAGTNGGDVHAQAGALGQFSNCTFTNGTAIGNGGGVWAASNAQTMFTSCTFSNSSAGTGGGMYLEEASIIVTDTTIENATITGDRGCGVYALTTTATALPVFNSGTISNCDVTFAGGSFGGGLYLEGTAGMFTMIDTIVTLCDTDYGGGAYIDGANPLLSATFSDCTATYFGGGTYIDDNSNVAYSNANYDNNVSLYRGGGVYVYPSANATFTWVDGSVTNNGSPRGGGVYVSDDAAGTFTDVLFRLNTASDHGAGLSAYSGSIIELDSCSFERNTCPAGGGVYMWRSDMTIIGATKFDANTASWGPAIYAHNSMTTMDNSLFSDNIANYDGGAVYLKGGSHTLEKVAFNSNSSVYGSVDGLAMIGTADISELMLDNCYFGNMANSAFSATSGVAGSYGDLVYCNVGTLVINPGGMVNLGGNIELLNCTSEADLLGIINGTLDDVDNNWVVDTMAGDLDGDGTVGANDLIILLQSLQQNSDTGDIDGNGNVDVRDLIMLLMAWS